MKTCCHHTDPGLPPPTCVHSQRRQHTFSLQSPSESLCAAFRGTTASAMPTEVRNGVGVRERTTDGVGSDRTSLGCGMYAGDIKHPKIRQLPLLLLPEPYPIFNLFSNVETMNCCGSVACKLQPFVLIPALISHLSAKTISQFAGFPS